MNMVWPDLADRVSKCLNQYAHQWILNRVFDFRLNPYWIVRNLSTYNKKKNFITVEDKKADMDVCNSQNLCVDKSLTIDAKPLWH